MYIDLECAGLLGKSDDKFFSINLTNMHCTN